MSAAGGGDSLFEGGTGALGAWFTVEGFTVGGERFQQRGLEKLAEAGQLGADFAFFKPEVAVGFGLCIKVESGVDQAPLAGVGDQGERALVAAKPLDDFAEQFASAANSHPSAVVEEDGKAPAIAADPEVVRFERFTRGEDVGILAGNVVAAIPDAGFAGLEAEDGQQTAGNELGGGKIAAFDTGDVPAKLVGEIRVQRRDGVVALDALHFGGSEQQALMAQAFPPRLIVG